MGHFDGGWSPYVPVAQRRANALRKVDALKKKGLICQPVNIEGRTIARTFWGKNWCDNLESYSDFANRLPRGRTYVRNGSVVDLQIKPGKVTALVAGSEIYTINIQIHALPEKLWQSIMEESAGKVASLVELLQGRLSSAVMEIVTRHGSGLFPTPAQIDFHCSCPDSASLCKHVAAALYGVGARLDQQPDLLFSLRHVDPQELIRQAVSQPIVTAPIASDLHPMLNTSDLSALFGIELEQSPVTDAAPDLTLPAPPPTIKKITRKTTAARFKAGQIVTAKALIARGIPRHMIQSWLDAGVVRHGEKRGEYLVTAQTEKRVAQYLTKRQT